jgi:hypothetical protein
MTTKNPLAMYFRKPAIHLTLPSQGKFYPDGSLEMPETQELPVYPMSALDEITYKTPDALFNGSAIIDVIKSCIPAIIDPWQMPAIDLPAILAGIRIASSGHKMEIDTTCPQCGEISTYEIDLRQVLDNLNAPDFAIPLVIGDLEVFFKPLSYLQVNDSNKSAFSQEQIAKIIKNDNLSDEEKINLMSDTFKKLSKFTMESLAHNINAIRTPGEDVDDYKFILEFLKNCDKKIFDAIKKEIITQRHISELKPMSIVCDNKKCKHKYEQPFTLDMSTFFE